MVLPQLSLAGGIDGRGGRGCVCVCATEPGCSSPPSPAHPGGVRRRARSPPPRRPVHGPPGPGLAPASRTASSPLRSRILPPPGTARPRVHPMVSLQ